MAKAVARYVCQACGATHARWSGRCEACGAWNSITEEAPREAAPKGLGNGAKGRKLDFVGLTGAADAAERRLTRIDEFDRVTGGGLVPGSAILIGGDPGIGKSTLLLQVMAALAGKPGADKAAAGARCLYVSGEEAIARAVTEHEGSLIMEANKLEEIKETLWWRQIRFDGKKFGLPKGLGKELKRALGPWARQNNVKTKGLPS